MPYPAPRAVAGRASMQRSARLFRRMVIRASSRADWVVDARRASACGASRRRVEPLDQGRVLLGDHATLDLERGREFSRILAQLVVEQRELLDLFELREIGVDFVDERLIQLARLGLLEHLWGLRVRPALGPGLGPEVGQVRDEERHDVRAMVAEQDGLAHPPTGLEPRFEGLRSDLLATGSDQQ